MPYSLKFCNHTLIDFNLQRFWSKRHREFYSQRCVVHQVLELISITFQRRGWPCPFMPGVCSRNLHQIHAIIRLVDLSICAIIRFRANDIFTTKRGIDAALPLPCQGGCIRWSWRRRYENPDVVTVSKHTHLNVLQLPDNIIDKDHTPVIFQKAVMGNMAQKEQSESRDSGWHCCDFSIK